MASCWKLPKRSARAEEAGRAKDEFLAVVSHELRTPLNAMLGWTRLLLSGQLDPATQRKALETIQRSALSQTQLIEDLLDVSRVITGKLRIDVAEVDLQEVVQAAVETVQPAAKAKGVRLKLVIDEGGQRYKGDAERLQQVVWNLVSNAVKFSDPGGFVELRLGQHAHEVVLEVEDRGRGIAAEFLPHVFDRFRQAEGGTKRRHSGLGLGLAITRHLVELHGGTISVHSEGLGQGALFTVRLPLAQLRP